LNIGDLDKDVWNVCIEGKCEWGNKRYQNIPEEIEAFITSYTKAETDDRKTWLLSASDFLSTSESEFAPDEFEKISLSSAEGDLNWRQEIIEFWNKHLPIYMSVKSGYEYIAYNLETGNFVEGVEPEFEETLEVASSISGFLKYVNDKNM
jgi:hypothetical protein